jgi:hypothetical protein
MHGVAREAFIMNPNPSERQAARWLAGATIALFLAIFAMHTVAQ